MTKPADQFKWQELAIGFAVTEPGNAREYKTGDWKSMHPEWDEKKCIKCGRCWVFCPDMAVYQKADCYFTVNLDYCKGCSICAKECPTEAIAMKEEP
jgi:pyruvate ferredoxin oxidoreductase delta subunit